MFGNQTNNGRHEERSTPSGFAASPCCAAAADFPGFRGDAKEFLRATPCAGFLRRHRLLIYTVAAAIGLGILIIQIGWILGIIAFFRTI